LENGQEQLIKLHAYTLSDGSLNRDRDGCWRLIFTNKDHFLLSDFKETIRSLGYNYYEQRCRRAIQVVARSRKLAEELLSLSPSYRTRPCSASPKCPRLTNSGLGSCMYCEPLQYVGKLYPPTRITNMSNRQLMKEFLKVYASCEGGVKLDILSEKPLKIRRQVFIATTNPFLSRQLIYLLRTLGISAREEWPSIVISYRANLQRFQEMVGFIPNCRVMKGKWKGLTKNELLTLTLRSYEDASLLKIHSKMFSGTG
jgi:hypothetical protein